MRGSHYYRQKKRGIILVEVLLAVTILSVGLIIILQSMTASRRNIALSLDYSRAAFLLENKITAMLEDNSSESAGGPQETITQDGRGYDYNVSSETADGAPDGLKKVKLALTWKAGSRNNEVNLQTYVFTPQKETSEE